MEWLSPTAIPSTGIDKGTGNMFYSGPSLPRALSSLHPHEYGIPVDESATVCIPPHISLHILIGGLSV